MIFSGAEDVTTGPDDDERDFGLDATETAEADVYRFTNLKV